MSKRLGPNSVTHAGERPDEDDRAAALEQSRQLVTVARDALKRALELRGRPILTGSTSHAIALALEAVEEAMT